MEYSQPNFLTALEDGTFTFAYGISPWLFALLVVLITIGVWFVYLKKIVYQKMSLLFCPHKYS